jgi:hypothetical protein
MKHGGKAFVLQRHILEGYTLEKKSFQQWDIGVHFQRMALLGWLFNNGQVEVGVCL